MQTIRFLLVLALFVFPNYLLAQVVGDSVPTTDAENAAKEILRQQNALLEQILVDAKNLRLPENRAVIYAKVGNGLWQTDEKRARALFQNSINDLLAAQTEAESEKATNKQYLNNLIYGQSPRWDILNIIAERDAEFALDALIKTRPAKIAQALAVMENDQSPGLGYARNEIQAEQRIIAQAAEQNPQRAVKLLRESLKKDVSYETINLLNKIFAKDPETANQLAEEVAQKILSINFNEDNQDTGILQNFLHAFGQKKADETPVLKVSDQTLRSLAEKLAKYLLRPTTNAYQINTSTIETIEKYSPASGSSLKQKQAQVQNQVQNAQSQNYSKLMNGEATPEELMRQADKFPRSYRNEIYRRAAEKTAESGNIGEAQNIITANMTAEEAENYISQINNNLATRAISEGKFTEAAQYINLITDENNRMSVLIYLATSIYQKDPKENQKWAASVLDQARALAPDSPEKISEMNTLTNIASAYINIEPAQAFHILENLIAPLNEYSEAAAVVAKYSDNGIFRQGEYQLNSNNNSFGLYNLSNVLKMLKEKDFDHTMRVINGFSRLDLRINLEMQLIEPNLSNNFRNMTILTRTRPSITGYYKVEYR